MKKIGLISIHSAHNYGSVLQAYALQTALQKFSQDVEIINYRPNYFNCQYNLFSIRVYKRYKGIFNKILHFGWRTIFFVSRYKKYIKFERFINDRMVLTKKYSKFDQLLFLKDEYDCVFCGSDQIWNTDITEGFDKSYYLGFASGNTIKASYAASVAREKIDPKYENDYVNYLNKLDFISIREKESVEELKKYVHKDINVNIDPTLLLEKEDWLGIAKLSKINIKYDYIFVYILQENPEFVKIVNDISEKLNLKVVSISKKKRFNNEVIIPEAGPEDFLHLCSNSSFVITNSFHGTVFSLIFEKKNCVIPHLNTGSRMVDLMKVVGLKDRIISEASSLDLDTINKDINYDNVKEIIRGERQKSYDYLNKVLNK